MAKRDPRMTAHTGFENKYSMVTENIISNLSEEKKNCFYCLMCSNIFDRRYTPQEESVGVTY